MSDEMKIIDLPIRESRVSSNGNGAAPHRPEAVDTVSSLTRETRRKYAYVYFAIALVLIAASVLDYVLKAPDRDLNPSPLDGVTLALEPQTPRGSSIIHFQLSNHGRNAVLYPVLPDTDAPAGLVLSGSSLRLHDTSMWERELEGTSISWVELRPGGWVDGQFKDLGTPAGNHAYSILLKLEGTSRELPVVSKTYSVALH